MRATSTMLQVRVFRNAPGNYGTNVNLHGDGFAVGDAKRRLAICL
jgi:hypothetical protein